MANNRYWNSRQIQERLRLMNLTVEQLQRILRHEYSRVYKEIKTLFLDLMNSLPPNPTADMLYREDKYYKLLSEIQYKLDHLGQIEKNHLEKTFSEYYVKNVNQIEGHVNIPIDDARVTKAINAVVPGDGKNFSDRIWKDKRQLVEKLSKGLVDTITTGRNWGSLSKEIQKDFNTSFFNARRLIRTELSRINNESALDKYRAEGVEEVRWIAEPDCCDECNKYNNKVFPVDKAPIPVINSHPMCKCCLIPIVKL